MQGVNNTSADYGTMFSKMFDMTSQTQTVTPGSGVTLRTSTEIMLATNADKTLGKIYGQVVANVVFDSSAYHKIATIASGLNTIGSEYIMKGYTIRIVANSVSSWTQGYLKFLTDGTVELWGFFDVVTGAISCDLPPCLLMLKDFGD